MVFREPTFKRISGTVAYGPFPIRKGRFAISFFALFFAVVTFGVASQRENVKCTEDASCVVSGTFRATTSIALRDVRVDIEHGTKGATNGVVVLIGDHNEEKRLMQQSTDDAPVTAAAIRVGLGKKQPIDVTVRANWWLYLLPLGTLALFFAIAHSALKGLGRFRLRVVQDGVALRVQRRILGVPVSSREISIDGVTEVRVERSELKDGWRGRGEAPLPAGRIVLLDGGGVAHAVTDFAYPGTAVHLRAASSLRALLALERQPGGVEDQLAELPLITTPLGSRIAFSWLGITCGSLAGMGLFTAAGLATGLMRPNDGEPWMFAVGLGGGAVAGVALVLYLTRARQQR